MKNFLTIYSTNTFLRMYYRKLRVKATENCKTFTCEWKIFFPSNSCRRKFRNPYKRDDLFNCVWKNPDDNVITVCNYTATWHSLLGQGQSKSLAAIGSREILARATGYIFLGDTVTCMDGFEHNQGMPYSRRDRGWPSCKCTFFENCLCVYTSSHFLIPFGNQPVDLWSEIF